MIYKTLHIKDSGMKTSKKEIIIRLYTHGVTEYTTIAKLCETSRKYVEKVVRNKILKLADVPALTEREYIKAYMQGIQSVKDMAAFFSVSERTIKRFRVNTRINEKLEGYKFVLNKQSKTTLPPGQPCTLGDALFVLKNVCQMLKPCAHDYDRAARNIVKIRKIIEDIKQIRP